MIADAQRYLYRSNVWLSSNGVFHNRYLSETERGVYALRWMSYFGVQRMSLWRDPSVRDHLTGYVTETAKHFPSMTATIGDSEVVHNDLDSANAQKGDASIRLSIPSRLYLVPSAAIIVGSAIGIVRGSGRASLRFLAENAHRPPTTVQGWYFYNKTKNYKVLWGGLKGAGVEASKLGAVALGWVGIEEGLERVGWGQVGEVGAALGTAGVFSALYRLPWRTTKRTLALGLIIGGSMSGMKLGRERLAQQQRAMNQNTD